MTTQIKGDALAGKDAQYFLYIEKHIETVKKVWKTFQDIPNARMLIADDFLYFTLNSLIMEHDASKKTQEEFYGYRYKFYPDERDELTDDYVRSGFEYAWNHHQKTNPHHWEYWVMLREGNPKPIPMPFHYVLEMLMDWTAMSLTVGKEKPSDWYSKCASEIVLNKFTKGVVDNWLPELDEVYAILVKEKTR
jgi:hypothetical protein